MHPFHNERAVAKASYAANPQSQRDATKAAYAANIQLKRAAAKASYAANPQPKRVAVNATYAANPQPTVEAMRVLHYPYIWQHLICLAIGYYFRQCYSLLKLLHSSLKSSAPTFVPQVYSNVLDSTILQ